MAQFKLIKKASARTIMGDVKKIAKELDTGEKMDLFTVIGTTNKKETGETDNGPWVAFRGRFQIENLDTGEVMRSGKLFLPDVASDLVVEALAGDDVAQIELGFLVGIQQSDNSATGYEYYAVPLIAPTEDDPLDRLSNSVKAALPKPEEKKQAPAAKKEEAKK